MQEPQRRPVRDRNNDPLLPDLVRRIEAEGTTIDTIDAPVLMLQSPLISRNNRRANRNALTCETDELVREIRCFINFFPYDLTTAMSETQKFTCYCGEWRFKNASFLKDEIREAVCRDLPFYAENDGKEYCVLHYPTKDKAGDFRPVLQERIDNGLWDFRMVYFPEVIEYDGRDFHVAVDFAHSTFAKGISFNRCTFYGRLDFFDSRFLEDATFLYSHFLESVNFNSVEFEQGAIFSGATFHEAARASFERTLFNKSSFASTTFQGDANFANAVFKDRTDFVQTKFFSRANFTQIAFADNAKAGFREANFHKAPDFRNAEFSELDFQQASFSGGDVRSCTFFTNCKFKDSVSFFGVEFSSRVDFSKAVFHTAHFEDSTFSRSADFSECQFVGDVFFNNTKFGYHGEDRVRSSPAAFDGATFGPDSRAFFDNTWFSWHTTFDYVRFDGYVFFKGSRENSVFDPVFERQAFQSLLKILNATFDKPEKVYFETVRLRPSWFVNIPFELRKFNLTDIDWRDDTGKFINIRSELRVIEKLRKHNSRTLLAVVFRQLADNAEMNSRFEEASVFRRMAMETEWLEKKGRIKTWIDNIVADSEKTRDRIEAHVFNREPESVDLVKQQSIIGESRRNNDFIIHWLYRVSSSYGESWARALTMFLLLVLLVFPAIYTQMEFQICPKELPVTSSIAACNSTDLEVKRGCRCRRDTLAVGDAVVHSLATATLQNVEYRKPISNKGDATIILEKLLAPLQAALVALALSRKFMR
jgi:uncharacterized protein YjbI with pentapeptide repeats